MEREVCGLAESSSISSPPLLCQDAEEHMKPPQQVFTIDLHHFAMIYSLWRSGWERVVQTQMGFLGACTSRKQFLLIPDALKTSLSMAVPAPGHCPGFLSSWCTQPLPTPFWASKLAAKAAFPLSSGYSCLSLFWYARNKDFHKILLVGGCDGLVPIPLFLLPAGPRNQTPTAWTIEFARKARSNNGTVWPHTAFSITLIKSGNYMAVTQCDPISLPLPGVKLPGEKGDKPITSWGKLGEARSAQVPA